MSMYIYIYRINTSITVQIRSWLYSRAACNRFVYICDYLIWLVLPNFPSTLAVKSHVSSQCR